MVNYTVRRRPQCGLCRIEWERVLIIQKLLCDVDLNLLNIMFESVSLSRSENG